MLHTLLSRHGARQHEKLEPLVQSFITEKKRMEMEHFHASTFVSMMQRDGLTPKQVGSLLYDYTPVEHRDAVQAHLYAIMKRASCMCRVKTVVLAGITTACVSFSLVVFAFFCGCNGCTAVFRGQSYVRV